MKLVWVIAIVLAILFGMAVALNFLGGILIGALVLLVVAGVFMAVKQFIALKIGSAILWLAEAAFWYWILSLCF